MTPFCESQHQLEPGLLEESTKFAITNTTISHDYYNARRRQWHPTPVLLPGKSHGQKSLVGCSPWDRWESDTTERLHFHFSLSRVAEGNGNPLQYSCLENPRDGRAWWAAVYGLAQSWTQLKRLSSSSSRKRLRQYLRAKTSWPLLSLGSSDYT